ncbi:DinB family protein [Lentzea tibetensis]|uniref:DinB family protein n=1 Tax=Lentzea tibetensis TaxID=2591470 RepID=A0A563F086_9PSEU|nr:DinB family protein [Lentzea tibetensis]TWP53329.1 DinB family protein [Lentzea tibetensis]
MAAEHEHTTAFRGARFTDSDLGGVRIRSCDLTGLRVVDSWLVDVNISGMVRNLVVNDVDVTAYVEAELEKRHPERAQLRTMRTPDDFRAMWATIERLWADATARAEQLPEAQRHERVDDEWSFVETVRHLVFATDAWAFSTVLDEPEPFHRLGLTHTSYPAADAAALGIELDARPTWAEVLEVRADRVARVRRIADGLTEEELERLCSRPPAPGYPDEERTVARCLGVVMQEECEHLRYALRDLAVLEAR